jgi:SAM-dependent methyltransferase
LLGSSSTQVDAIVRLLIGRLNPGEVLELGCGKGKFGELLKSEVPSARIEAVQKLFSPDDEEGLKSRGYTDVIDRDIMDFYREGFDKSYDLIVALDVIEHFLYSDIISIINFSLYRSEYMLLVWPSAHPQSAVTNAFDRHRASFELRDLSDKFDVVFYIQTGFSSMNVLHRYHLALLRGFMNVKTLPSLLV